jgi:hypothetical protein
MEEENDFPDLFSDGCFHLQMKSVWAMLMKKIFFSILFFYKKDKEFVTL